MNIKVYCKRSLVMLLVAYITFMSVFNAYQQTTQAAEWVAGTIAAIGGAPIMTALMVGGVVIAGGVALYELSQTTPEDHREFVSGIKQGFNSFVAEQEKQIILENNQHITENEAADQGVAIAREKVNNFFSNAIETTKNAVSNIALDVQKYWKQYCSSINEVCNYDENYGEVPEPSQNVPIPSYNANEKPDVNTNKTTSGSEIFEIFDGNAYITKAPIWGNQTLEFGYSQDRNYFFIPFAVLQSNNYLGIYVCQVNTHTKEAMSINTTNYYTTWGNASSLNNCFIPTFSINTDNINDLMEDIKAHYAFLLSVWGEIIGSSVYKTWEREIKNTLENTHIGKAIQTGRKQLVNEGDYVGAIFKNDSVPVQKSGVTVNDGVVTAPLGWSIPSAQTWDDVFSGGKPYADVVGKTGAIAVPDDVIIGTKDQDRVIEYPDTADVQDSADYPQEQDTPDNPTVTEKPQEIPEKPQKEIIDEQGGTFYPSEFDLTQLFPFCIPFDIIYLVDKFDVSGEQAPVITIPILYPTAIQNALGSSSYEVTINFEDFIVVRNIMRAFLLILFIVGLLKITRDLIRG